MRVTNKEIAEFCGLTVQTLYNYKKPLKKAGIKFFPAAGKHNLYIGAYLNYYLNNVNVNLPNTNLQNAIIDINNIKYLANILNLKCNNTYTADLLESVNSLSNFILKLEHISYSILK